LARSASYLESTVFKAESIELDFSILFLRRILILKNVLIIKKIVISLTNPLIIREPPMKLNSSQRQQGFTMAELIIVIAILAVLVVYLVRNFGVRGDDAKLAMVANILSKDVPAAFQAFILENSGCIDPATNAAHPENFADQAEQFTTENAGIKLLLDNGVPAGTPWQNAVATAADGPGYTTAYTVWDAEFAPSAAGAPGFLTLTFPLDGVGNIDRATEQLVQRLRNSSEIHSINGEYAAGGLGADRNGVAPVAQGQAGALVLGYNCS